MVFRLSRPMFPLVALLCLSPPALADSTFMAGVNLPGAEFGVLPGRVWTDYFYPSVKDAIALRARGMNVFRLPFRWERLQPVRNGPLDSAETDILARTVAGITATGSKVIVSPHNYARYGDAIVGSPALPNADFAQFWGAVATLFHGNDRVIFGLMNEPHDMPTEQWLGAANAAIAAIRRTGNRNLILVPGNAWTGGQSWASPGYGLSNAIGMLGVEDPAQNFAYEIHQYFDEDFSGTHEACQGPDIGAQSLAGVTDWLRAHKRRGFLAEFGATRNAGCIAALDNTLAFIDRSRDVWLGWTYWAAGGHFSENWFSAQPTPDGDPPQLKTILGHVKREAGPH